MVLKMILHTILKYYWAQIFVILDMRWPIDDYWACNSSRILGAVVSMVPACSINVRSEPIPSYCQLQLLFYWAFKTYVNEDPGAIGHCVIEGTPSYHGVSF